MEGLFREWQNLDCVRLPQLFLALCSGFCRGNLAPYDFEGTVWTVTLLNKSLQSIQWYMIFANNIWKYEKIFMTKFKENIEYKVVNISLWSQLCELYEGKKNGKEIMNEIQCFHKKWKQLWNLHSKILILVSLLFYYFLC